MCTAMIVLVLTELVMFGFGDAKFSARCSDHRNSTTTLTPANDGVRGRYVLEWCTTVTLDDANWHIDLSYISRKNLTVCPTNEIQYFKHHHTSAEETIYKKLPKNCSNVCLSKGMDLLFSACYSVRNWIPEHGSFSSFSFHNVSNNYTKEMFDHFEAVGSYVIHGDYVNVHFNLKNVPATDFILELHKMDPKDPAHSLWTKNINTECAFAQYEIMCTLRELEGLFRVYIDAIEAPWARGGFARQRRTFTLFEVNRTLAQSGGLAAEAGAGAGARAAAWACGALGAASAGALLLLLALRCRRAAHRRKHVLRDWLSRVDKKPSPAEVRAPVGPILLLYARECPAAEPVIEALKNLLETVAPGQVYDIGSPTTLALAASAGGDWIRGVLARADARVVLLQTPALHALHTPRLVCDAREMRLEQPLLMSRVAYRAPGAGDALLTLALRLLAAAHAPAPAAGMPYRKYYLATLEGLETEALPYTVPFRRYLLPRHAATLLHDLAPPARPPPPGPAQRHQLDRLAHAAVGFLDYARENPNYLMDELLVIQ